MPSRFKSAAGTVLKGIPKNQVAFIGMILLLILLAYGLLTPWIGFFWDDWPFAWLLHFLGPSEFIDAFRPFRPFLGPIFTATTTLFGENPFTWQLVGLAVRFLLCLEVWYILRYVWHAQKWNLAWVVLLFTVYPGFQQQWVALTHVNQELIPLLWLMASFGVTFYALRERDDRKGLTVIALLLQVLGLFSTEYFFGLEILRFLFLIVVFAESSTSRKDALTRAVIRWLPYFCVWIFNAIWTYEYHRSSAYNSYGLNVLSRSSFSPLKIVNEIITTISLSGFESWLNSFQIFSTTEATLSQVISFVIFLLSAFAVFRFMNYIPREAEEKDENKVDVWGRQATIIGLIGIFAGRLPSWAAGLTLKLAFDYDRFMLPIMFGASMFIIGLATLILKDGRRKILLLSILIGLSTAYQFSVSNTFRRDWQNQQAFLWQLTWRIPALQKDTVLIAQELPFKYVSDRQFTAPINWIYSPSIENRKLPYLLVYIKSRLSSSTLPSLQPDHPIQDQYRTVYFTGSTSDSVVLYKGSKGCLRILDPVYGNSQTVPGASSFLSKSIELSSPDRIQTDAPQPILDAQLFGPEPKHDWCYFYEKAELARQQLDWNQVVKLYDQAQQAGLSASVPVENLPFIEGFAVLGKKDEALELTDRTLRAQKDLCPALYTLWNRVLQTAPAGIFTTYEINERFHKGGCRTSTLLSN